VSYVAYENYDALIYLKTIKNIIGDLHRINRCPVRIYGHLGEWIQGVTVLCVVASITGDILGRAEGDANVIGGKTKAKYLDFTNGITLIGESE